MQFIFRYVTLILVLIFSATLSDANAQYVEFETSWEKAKKNSKDSGKPIIAIFGRSRHNKMERNFFNVDSIATALKNEFVLYRHEKGKKPWYIRSYPTIVICDAEENRYKQMIYYYVKDSFIEEIFNYKDQKSLSAFESEYKKGENDIVFLESYVRYSLKYHLGLSEVYYDYYNRIDSFNCLKLQCVTQSLCHSLPTQEYLDHYQEMISLDCGNNDVEKRLFSLFQRDYIDKEGRNPEIERYSNIDEAVIKTTAFLGKGNRHRDSLFTYMTWRYLNIPKWKLQNEEEVRKSNIYLLKCFDYKMENIYTQDSLQTLLFDLSISIDNRSELEQLEEIILNRPHFINDAAMVEVLAIVYHRLGLKERSDKMILRADKIALKNGVNYYSILPDMNDMGLLKKVDK